MFEIFCHCIYVYLFQSLFYILISLLFFLYISHLFFFILSKIPSPFSKRLIIIKRSHVLCIILKNPFSFNEVSSLPLPTQLLHITNKLIDPISILKIKRPISNISVSIFIKHETSPMSLTILKLSFEIRVLRIS